MYLALDQVHPITLAVGNTAKRVFIIVAALVSLDLSVFWLAVALNRVWCAYRSMSVSFINRLADCFP